MSNDAQSVAEINRYLSLLRTLIRERGYTQLEVQAQLSWGRSYISQLLTRAKTFRVDQVLSILKVIGVSPEAFFAQLYQLATRPGGAAGEAPTADAQEIQRELDRVKAVLGGLLRVLEEKGVLDADDLARATQKARTMAAP